MLKNQIRLGFTLLELIIVIILIGVLASMALVRIIYLIEKAKTVEAINVLSTIRRIQGANFEIYGTYLGSAPPGTLISSISAVTIDTNHMTDWQFFVSNSANRIGMAIRVPNRYKLSIHADGKITCEPLLGPAEICQRLSIPTS